MRKKYPPNSIKQLRHGDPMPSGEPRRYREGRGYIRLRWKVGPYSYVETYEHRIVAGLQAPHVHHRNHQKDDNSPENLLPMTARQHRKEHITWNRAEAAELYAGGAMTTTLASKYGITCGQVSRGLRASGVAMRTSGASKRFDLDVEKIRSLFMAGNGQRRIAKVFGCSTAPIVRVLASIGLSRPFRRVLGAA